MAELTLKITADEMTNLIYEHLKALNSVVDTLCPLVARAASKLPPSEFTFISELRKALNDVTDVQNKSYDTGVAIENVLPDL